jgi:hypothetical protein
MNQTTPATIRDPVDCVGRKHQRQNPPDASPGARQRGGGRAWLAARTASYVRAAFEAAGFGRLCTVGWTLPSIVAGGTAALAALDAGAAADGGQVARPGWNLHRHWGRRRLERAGCCAATALAVARPMLPPWICARPCELRPWLCIPPPLRDCRGRGQRAHRLSCHLDRNTQVGRRCVSGGDVTPAGDSGCPGTRTPTTGGLNVLSSCSMVRACCSCCAEGESVVKV